MRSVWFRWWVGVSLAYACSVHRECLFARSHMRSKPGSLGFSLASVASHRHHSVMWRSSPAPPRDSRAPSEHVQRGARGGPTASDVIDAFLAEILHEDVASPCAPWGDKVGYSIFSEEEVLGQPVNTGGPFAGLGELGETGTQEAMIQELARGLGQPFDIVSALLQLLPPMSSHSLGCNLPRRVRSIVPFCRLYRSDQDLPGDCLICLGQLTAGQVVWRLPCTHVFHNDCMTGALGARQATARCPTCRCDIKRIATISAADL